MPPKEGNLSLGAPDSPIFLNLKGEPLQGRYVRKMVAQAARKAVVQKQVHPHTLRHTFATDLLRATKNLRLVQKALGMPGWRLPPYTLILWTRSWKML